MKRSLSFVALSVTLFACHAAHAADPPHPPSPAVEIEVEDRAPNGPLQTARFSLFLVDGHAEVSARDGSSAYVIKALTDRSSDARYALSIKRSGGPTEEVELHGAVPIRPSSRILVARVDRKDGQVTSVFASVH